MPRRSWRTGFWLAAAAAACLQWPAQLALGLARPGPFYPGLSILGASFILSWAAETAELDVPHGAALALLAIVAVLPEYAVDVYFAWTAGKSPAHVSFATANMTGANRLLIGLGWSAVLLTARLARGRREIRLDPEVGPELLALAAATLYAFILPYKRTLSLVDAAVLLAIFALYAFRLSGAEGAEPELAGPAAALADLAPAFRRAAVAALFCVSAGSIYLAAAPFAEGLVAAGRRLGFDEFLLVQWVAPLASEAPEFIVACLFAFKGRAGSGLRMLVASKVNQWTLLVGMLPVVFAASARAAAPMPLDLRQADEILLTAAQSLLALAMLFDLRFSWKEAATLTVLFAAQPFLVSPHARLAFSAAYVALAVWVLLSKGSWKGVLAAAGAAMRRA